MKIDAMTFRNDPMLKLLLISGTILLYLGVAAAYFDEWWHADQRVETFFTLPHAVLYASIFLNGMLVLSYVLLQCNKIGRFAPARIPGSSGLALAGTGSLFQLCAGLFDMVYHDLVGFDVSIWSPPHLLAIFGGVLSAVGFAGLWQKVSIIGYIFASAAAVNFGQFALSEFFVDGAQFQSRFSTVPAYYPILIGLIMGFVLTASWIQLGKSWATPILFLSFVTHVLVWAAWSPTKLSIEFSFPAAIFAAGAIADFWVRQKRIRNDFMIGLLFTALASSIIVWIAEASSFTLAQFLFAAAGSVAAAAAGYFLASKLKEGEQYA